MGTIFEINSSISKKTGFMDGEVDSTHRSFILDKNCSDCDEWTCFTCDNEGGGNQTCNLDPSKPITCALQGDTKCKDCEEYQCVTCDNEPKQ